MIIKTNYYMSDKDGDLLVVHHKEQDDTVSIFSVSPGFSINMSKRQARLLLDKLYGLLVTEDDHRAWSKEAYEKALTKIQAGRGDTDALSPQVAKSYRAQFGKDIRNSHLTKRDVRKIEKEMFKRGGDKK